MRQLLPRTVPVIPGPEGRWMLPRPNHQVLPVPETANVVQRRLEDAKHERLT